MIEAVIVITLLLLTMAAWPVIGSLVWALWYVRRTYWRHMRYSLRTLLFAFTIASLAIGAFAILMRG